MQQVNSGSPVVGPIIAAAIEVVVASEANPTPELSLIGTSVPNWAMTVTATGGTDEATLYRLDATADAANPPYIVNSATVGLKWIAIAGRYQNQSIASASLTASRVVITGASGLLTTDNGLCYVGGVLLVGTNAVISAAEKLQVLGTIFASGNADFGATEPNASVRVRASAGTSPQLILAAPDGTAHWSIYETMSGVAAGNLRLYDPARAANSLEVVVGTGVTKVLNSVNAASAITGGLIVGDGVTALTNVGIGGGNIVAGGNVSVRSVPYVWPAANAAGALTNDGAGNLTWTAAGVSAVAAFWAGINNAAWVSITGAAAATANRMHIVSGTAGDYDITLPAAPAAGTVVGFHVVFYGSANKQYRLDAGVGVIVCGRTRYLTLLHTNVVLLQWTGAEWVPLVMCLDTPWINAGAVTITAVTTNPTKGTVVRDAFWWRRVGNSMEVRYEYNQSGGGTAGSGAYLVPLPYPADTAVVFQSGSASLNTQKNALGSGKFRSYDTGTVILYSATHLYANISAEFWSSTNATYSGASYLCFDATVPALDW